MKNLASEPSSSMLGAGASSLVTLGLLGTSEEPGVSRESWNFCSQPGRNVPSTGQRDLEGVTSGALVLPEGNSCPPQVIALLLCFPSNEKPILQHQLLQRPLPRKWVVLCLNRTAPTSVILIKAVVQPSPIKNHLHCNSSGLSERKLGCWGPCPVSSQRAAGSNCGCNFDHFIMKC